MKVFQKVEVESLYSEIDTNKAWQEFYNYLLINSSSLYVHQITDDELKKFVREKYDTLKVGGWPESIIINIVSSLIYDVSKMAVKRIIRLISKVGKQKAKEEGFTDFGGGDVSIAIKYKDGKSIEIHIPFAIDTKEQIDAIDFSLIEIQFKKSRKARLFYDIDKGKYTDKKPWPSDNDA